MRSSALLAAMMLSLAMASVACSPAKSSPDGGRSNPDGGSLGGADGPADAGPTFAHDTGDADAGRTVFRFETFGNEGFWTSAMKLPQGMIAAGVTPMQALATYGLNVDWDALAPSAQSAITAEIAASGTSGPILNDPATTVMLINANAIVGLVVKDTNGDETLDVTNGDQAGVSCASCHSITDSSVLAVPGGGGIGHRVDGPSNHNLQVGKIFALAQNSRAYFPLLQLKLAANGNTTIGRAPLSAAITKDSSETDVDYYLNNYYPAGMFDDAPDGVGAPMHITPMFRTRNNAPYGTPGDIARLDNFANLVYSALLDPTTLVGAGGRNFLMALGGRDAGMEIADDYQAVLTATGVHGPGSATAGEGFPFLHATLPAGVVAGSEDAPVGLRVDEQELLDMNAYTDSLPPPRAPSGLDATRIAAGRQLFRTQCTACHNVDQSLPVPGFLLPLTPGGAIFPAYDPTILATRPTELPFRPAPFAPIQDDPHTIFDDKLVIVEASRRGAVRGLALPVLLDLARKPVFLHDNSVPSLDALFDPSRGATAPHPFYVSDSAQRAQVVEFLKSLEAP